MQVSTIYRYGPGTAPVLHNLAFSATVGHAASNSLSTGAETQITPFTATNASGSAKTSEIVVFGIGLPPGALTGGKTLNLYDDDGSGGKGSRLNFQLNNWCSIDGTGTDPRWVRGCAIIPSIGSNATRVGRIFSSTTAVPTGTTITAADLLALGCMANGGVVVENTISGVTYSANLATLLAGGSSFSKTSEVDQGDWSSGPIMFERLYSGPLRNSGTAHASGDGMRVNMLVRAWKAGTGAVNGANPILGLMVRVRVHNGHRTVGTEYTVSTGRVRRATSLTDATLIHSTDTDPDGNTITYDYTTSYNHWGKAAWVRDVYVGVKPTTIAVLGNLTTTTSGTAVTPTGQQMYDYWETTDLVPKYGEDAVFANVNHSGFISQLNGTSKTKPLQTSGSHMGNIDLNEPAGGDRPDLRMIPDWYVQYLIKPDANGRRLLFENSQYISQASLGGRGIRVDSTTARFYKHGDTYGSLSGSTTSDPFSYDEAHECERGYVAYLMTGDENYYYNMNARCAAFGPGNIYTGTGQDQTFYGDHSEGGILIVGAGYTQPNNPTLTDWSDQQMRSAAWSFRTVMELGLICPDRFTTNNLLSWDKAWAVEWVDRHLERFINVIEANTGSSSTWNRYGTGEGIRWCNSGTNDGATAPVSQFSGFMMSYWGMVMYMGRRMYTDRADWAQCSDWISDFYIGGYNSPDICRDFFYDTYWGPMFDVIVGESESALNRCRTSGEYYRARARARPNVSSQPRWSTGDNTRWAPSGSLTLSAASGSSITATYPAGMINPGSASWYIGMWVRAGTGRATITGVNTGAHTMTLSTTATDGVTFASTSFASGSWEMPLPHPLDNPGDLTRSGGGTGGFETSYVDLARAVMGMAANRGVTGALATYTYLRALKPVSDEIGHDTVP